MNLIKFFNNIDFLLEKRDKIKLYLIFLGMIFASILELIGIGYTSFFNGYFRCSNFSKKLSWFYHK